MANSSTAAMALLDLIQSHRVTATIYVAAKLGIAELLREEPKSSGELAHATGAHSDALARLLVALTTIGISARGPDGRYRLTELGAALDGAADPSLKAWAIFEGDMLYESWGGLLDTVTTGRTRAELSGSDNSFTMMSRHPQKVRIFNAAMNDLTRFITSDVLSSYDFGRIAHLLDVGAGSAYLSAAIARQYPHLRVTAFDLACCAEVATAELQRAGVSERATFVAGNFFDRIPAVGDAIILKSVIHDWTDERSALLLTNCREALPRGGLLLIVERIMPDQPRAADQDRAHALSDINMLRGPGGRERTATEYRNLLLRSGFLICSIRPAGRFSLIEAEKI